MSNHEKGQKHNRQESNMYNKDAFNVMEFTNILHMLQDNQMISSNQIEYFQVNQAVAKALDLPEQDSEDILDLISEHDNESGDSS